MARENINFTLRSVLSEAIYVKMAFSKIRKRIHYFIVGIKIFYDLLKLFYDTIF